MGSMVSSSGSVCGKCAGRSTPLSLAGGRFLTKLIAFSLPFVSSLANPRWVEAQITQIAVFEIDNSAGGPALDGFATYDVSISFDGRYTGSQLLIQLSQGSIYQDPDGGDIAPATFPTPSSQFDSFIGQGWPTIGQVAEPLQFAVNLGGSRPARFDTTMANLAWHPQPPTEGTNGAFLEDLSDLLTVRVSLSDDATGTWAYLASAGGVFIIEERLIQDGVLSGSHLLPPVVIPEGSSLSLIVISTLMIAFCGRRFSQPLMLAPGGGPSRRRTRDGSLTPGPH